MPIHLVRDVVRFHRIEIIQRYVLQPQPNKVFRNSRANRAAADNMQFFLTIFGFEKII
jgi:hypothetical protein